MDLMLLIGIVTIVLMIIVSVLPIINKRYYRRPKLVIEMIPNKGITSVRKGLGQVNKGNGLDPNSKFAFEQEWFFDLIIRNNSEINSYQIELFQPESKSILKFNEEPNIQKALLRHEEWRLSFVYNEYFILKRKDISEYSQKYPNRFKDLRLLLQYKNEYGTSFTSIYSYNNKSNSYKKLPVSELKYWKKVIV